MSTPCTACGQPLDTTTRRCPTCGALASPVSDDTVALAAADPTPSAGAPPWSIPIRDPGDPDSPSRTRAGARGRRTAGVALVGAAAVALALVAGARVLDDDSSSARDVAQPATPAPAGTGGMDSASVRSAADAATSTTSTSTSETTESSTTTTAAPTATTTTVPTTTTTAFSARTAPNGTGSVPALSTSFRGWLAQLTSVPYSAGTDGLAEEWRRTTDSVPGAVAARSDDWAGLRDGFWVLVEPGPFASADEVRSFCAAAGFDGDDQCLPRELRG